MRSILFEHPAYGWFWCARVASGMAFQIQAVAVGWQVYEITHSTFQLGMVGLVQFLPIVLLSLIHISRGCGSQARSIERVR